MWDPAPSRNGCLAGISDEEVMSSRSGSLYQEVAERIHEWSKNIWIFLFQRGLQKVEFPFLLINQGARNSAAPLALLVHLAFCFCTHVTCSHCSWLWTQVSTKSNATQQREVPLHTYNLSLQQASAVSIRVSLLRECPQTCSAKLSDIQVYYSLIVFFGSLLPSLDRDAHHCLAIMLQRHQSAICEGVSQAYQEVGNGSLSQTTHDEILPHFAHLPSPSQSPQ